MSSSTASKHVAVIGGGILGVSTAVHLLREGASVTLLTERGLASEATGRSLSWLNSAGERSTPYHQLRLAGVDRYRTLFAADPSREWLQFGGGLMWNAAGERAVTEARHAYEKSVGYDSKLLGPKDIASVTPGIDSPAEWATIHQTGVPAATTEPIIDPAEVPTIRVASIGSQPVSVASA